MKIHNCQQGSDEWFALRTGRITGTRIAKMAGGTKPTIDGLCYEVASEIITGQRSDAIKATPAMERGTEMEAEARSAFSAEYLLNVVEVGFFEVDDLFGVSPDGLIGDDAGLELKCPLPHTHLKYITAGDKAWRAYRWQVQGCLWATGRARWYFASYCPLFDGMELVVNVVGPDADDLAKIAEKAEYCRGKINEILEVLK